jgi:hypothetical protein
MTFLLFVILVYLCNYDKFPVMEFSIYGAVNYTILQGLHGADQN